MTPRLAYIGGIVLPAALAVLPRGMDTPRARALLLAVGLQESKFEARRQQPAGPARGFWQFERGGGVAGVLAHAATAGTARAVLDMLGYPPHALAVHLAIEHNDIAAAAFARLLLFSDPRALPAEGDPAAGWAIYLDTWRPGKPHAGTWAAHYEAAWRAVHELEAARRGRRGIQAAPWAAITDGGTV